MRENQKNKKESWTIDLREKQTLKRQLATRMQKRQERIELLRKEYMK